MRLPPLSGRNEQGKRKAVRQLGLTAEPLKGWCGPLWGGSHRAPPCSCALEAGLLLTDIWLLELEESSWKFC